MLTKLKEMGREKCSQYWPIGRTMRYGYFIIDPLGEYHMSQYLLSELKLTDSRVKNIIEFISFITKIVFCFIFDQDGQTRTIRHFHYAEWPEQGVPKVGEGFIDFIGQVHKTKEGFGQDGPIVVHCSAGKLFRQQQQDMITFFFFFIYYQRCRKNRCFPNIKYRT